MEQKLLVFVYGSLLSGLHNHRWLERAGTELVDTDTIDGRIYQVHWSYPALDKSGEGIVKGEVYSITPETLRELDLLESYNPRDPENSGYIRTMISTHGGREVIVYSLGTRMARHFVGQPHIESGDWRAQYASNQAQRESEEKAYREKMDAQRALRRSKAKKK